MGFPGGSEVKVSACNVGDLGSIPGLGRSHGEGNGSPLQYSCLENPVGGGAWWATVHGVTELDTTERLYSLHFNGMKSQMKIIFVGLRVCTIDNFNNNNKKHSMLFLKSWFD